MELQYQCIDFMQFQVLVKYNLLLFHKKIQPNLKFFFIKGLLKKNETNR